MKKLLNSDFRTFVLYGIVFIVGLYFLLLGLVKAQNVIAPLVTAMVLSLVILPLTQKMEHRMSKNLASLLSTLILVVISFVMIGLIFLQLKNFTDSWPNIKETMKPKIDNFQAYAIENLPVTESDFMEFREQISATDSGLSIKRTGKKISGFIARVLGFIGNYLLTFIYVFFMLRYRLKFKRFLIGISDKSRQPKIKEIFQRSSKVATQYLIGKLILISLLSVVYSIGLGLSGVSNFILVSIIAAVLTIIPYVGNIIGYAMALAFGYLTTGNPMTLVGITLTFVISQFLESYVLQPYVVGDKVDVHPFFVIVSVILGNFLWGIIGMVLAIPIMGILVVILQHIPETNPIGVLLSTKSMDEAS